MEQLLRAQIGGIFEMFVDEIDLARLALSCHFALDVLCDKETFTTPHDGPSGQVFIFGCLQIRSCIWPGNGSQWSGIYTSAFGCRIPWS